MEVDCADAAVAIVPSANNTAMRRFMSVSKGYGTMFHHGAVNIFPGLRGPADRAVSNVLGSFGGTV